MRSRINKVTVDLACQSTCCDAHTHTHVRSVAFFCVCRQKLCELDRRLLRVGVTLITHVHGAQREQEWSQRTECWMNDSDHISGLVKTLSCWTEKKAVIMTTAERQMTYFCA